jgi:AcrR family transcriptional regulator
LHGHWASRSRCLRKHPGSLIWLNYQDRLSGFFVFAQLLPKLQNRSLNRPANRPTRGPPSGAKQPAGEPTVKQRVLDAALVVLRRDGYAGFTQQQVAAQAGVRQSHLTYYFPTRNELLKGVAQAAKVEALANAGAQADALQRGRPVSGVPAITQKTTTGTRSGLRQLGQHISAQLDTTALPRLMVALTAASDEDPSLRAWLADFEEDNKAQFALALLGLGLRVPAPALNLFHATVVGATLLNFQQGTPAAKRRASRICRLAFDQLIAGARAVWEP